MATLVFGVDGGMSTIYSDDTAELLRQLGDVETMRASHVEPDGAGGWTADMAPVGGPVLGPFSTRAAALSAEVAWLTDWMAR